MFSALRSSIVVLGAAALLVSACKGEKSPGPAAAAASASAKVPAVQSLPPLAADPQLMEKLQAMAKTCQRVPNEPRVNCAEGAQWKLVGTFVDGSQPRSNAAISTLAQALADADPGLSCLSATVLRSAFGGAWANDKTPPKIEPRVADALLTAVVAQPPAVAKQIVPAAVNASILAGRTLQLLSELAKPQNSALSELAYPYLMTFGRIAELPRVQRLVKEGALPVALAALDAPLNMPAWTGEEAKQICDWTQSLLPDTRAPISRKAALVLSACSGAWIDALLERSEKVLASEGADIKDVTPLASMCVGGAAGRPQRATDKQCKQAHKLLASFAQSKRADAAVRKEARRLLDAATASPAAPVAG